MVVVVIIIIIIIIIMPPPFNLSGEGTFVLTTDREKQLAWTQISVHALTLPSIDRITLNAWLTWGELLPETEGFMCTIQDQVVYSRNYRNSL